MRRFFTTMILGLVTALLLAQAGQARDGERDRVAIVVNEASEEKMIAAVTMAISRARRAAAKGEMADIRVLAHGDGLTLLRDDRSPAAKRLRFAAKSFSSISFHACAFTQGQVAIREGAEPTILSFARNVPKASVTVSEMERDGWAILRP